MAAYKLSKNHWVMPFFVIFRYVRDILLVTVAFDHPVALGIKRSMGSFHTRHSPQELQWWIVNIVSVLHHHIALGIERNTCSYHPGDPFALTGSLVSHSSIDCHCFMILWSTRILRMPKDRYSSSFNCWFMTVLMKAIINKLKQQ